MSHQVWLHSSGILVQSGEVSAAAAAGLYCEERRALLSSLWMLLQAQVTPKKWEGLFSYHSRNFRQ
jgi:hypothetical protein